MSAVMASVIFIWFILWCGVWARARARTDMPICSSGRILFGGEMFRQGRFGKQCCQRAGFLRKTPWPRSCSYLLDARSNLILEKVLTCA
jgi:hypothetical protein